MIPFDPDLLVKLPLELRDRRQWCCWRSEERDGKLTKVPRTPDDRRFASNEPDTWSSFDEALAAAADGPHRFSGIGFAFSADDPYLGIDLDHCVDPESRKIARWAERILEMMGSYAEISPSGTGIKITVRGTMPGSRHKQIKLPDEWQAGKGAAVEMYGQARYFTYTGQRFGDRSTIEPRQAAIDQLYADLFPEQPATALSTPRALAVGGAVQAGDLSDSEVIDRARKARNGDLFAALWDDGDLSTHGGNHSAADLALANLLAFYAGPDPARIERLFSMSALGQRDKWVDREDYRKRTIEKALEGRTEFYAPRRSSANGHTHALQPAGASPMLPTPHRTALRDADKDEDKHPPVIATHDRQLIDVVDEALEVLAQANHPPVIFRRGGQVVRVQMDETDWPVIAAVGEHAMRGRLARIACWTGSGGRPIHPPAAVSQTILTEPTLPLPPLVGLTQVPILRPDGSVLDGAGYDPMTQLYYAPPGSLKVPQIPMAPTASDVAEARRILLDMVAEFPFVDSASQANLYALWLTPVIRSAVTGPVPMAIVDAPSPGTGKSLLVEVVCRTASGRSTATTAPRDEDEWRKRLTALLIEGAGVIVIDNIRGQLNSDQLAAAITADWWADRELGRSGMVRVQQRATWVATGNNIALGGDLPRRSYHIRLDSKVPRPWEREGFKIEHLRQYVDLHRGEVLAALLILGRAWWAAGCPAVPVKRLGGFEPWASIVAGILGHAGIEGFLGNQDAMYEAADDDAAETEEFLRAWYDVFGDAEVKAAQVVGATKEDLAKCQVLRDALPSWAVGRTNEVETRKLGTNLKSHIDRRFGSDGIMLQRASEDKHSKTARWRVVITAGSAGSCGELWTQRAENGETHKPICGEGAETLPADPALPAESRLPWADPDHPVRHVLEEEGEEEEKDSLEEVGLCSTVGESGALATPCPPPHDSGAAEAPVPVQQPPGPSSHKLGPCREETATHQGGDDCASEVQAIARATDDPAWAVAVWESHTENAESRGASRAEAEAIATARLREWASERGFLPTEAATPQAAENGRQTPRGRAGPPGGPG